MVSAVDLAKRAFIKVLLQLAVTYAVKLSLSRDSPADAVNAAYRKVSLKVHPDKGGTDDQQTALNAAREAWESAKVAAPGKGKKRKAATFQKFTDKAVWPRDSFAAIGGRGLAGLARDLRDRCEEVIKRKGQRLDK